MSFSLIGAIHLGAALTSVASGAFVLLCPKAGQRHRRSGYVYAAAMTLMNLTALSLYRLTGTVNFFHVAAVASLVTLICGLRFAIVRRPASAWIELHYRLMFWSYVGLLAALVAEVSTRVLKPWLLARGSTAMSWFWLVVAAVSLAVVIVGGVGIEVIGRRTASRVRQRL